VSSLCFSLVFVLFFSHVSCELFWFMGLNWNKLDWTEICVDWLIHCEALNWWAFHEFFSNLQAFSPTTELLKQVYLYRKMHENLQNCRSLGKSKIRTKCKTKSGEYVRQLAKAAEVSGRSRKWLIDYICRSAWSAHRRRRHIRRIQVVHRTRRQQCACVNINCTEVTPPR